MQKISLKRIILAILIILLLGFLIPIEIHAFKFKPIIYGTFWVAIPLFAHKFFDWRNSVFRIVLASVGGIIYASTSCFFLLNMFFCPYGEQWDTFINKKNKSIKIVTRSWSCFMTDNVYELYKERKITNDIKWVTKFTNLPIDTTEWKSVKF
jgi:hypothetical protein